MIVIHLLTVQILGIVSCIVHDPLLMNDHRGDSPFTMCLDQFQRPPV